MEAVIDHLVGIVHDIAHQFVVKSQAVLKMFGREDGITYLFPQVGLNREDDIGKFFKAYFVSNNKNIYAPVRITDKKASDDYIFDITCLPYKCRHLLGAQGDA